MDELKKRLDYAEREISQEEIEEEQEREEALTKKHTSLRDSLIKVSKKVGEMQAKIAESGESPASKKSKLLVETSKRGALLESQQDVLKDKLKTAKAKADKVREKYISVRGVWNAANERVTEAQAEYDKCVSEIEQVSKYTMFFLFGEFLIKFFLLIYSCPFLYSFRRNTKIYKTAICHRRVRGVVVKVVMSFKTRSPRSRIHAEKMHFMTILVLGP